MTFSSLSPSICLSGSLKFDGSAALPHEDRSILAQASRRRVARCTLDAELGDTVEIMEGDDKGFRGELVNVRDWHDGTRYFLVEVSPDEIRETKRVLLVKKAS